MAALQCEICGGKLIGKPGGVFECDSCGMEYSTDWAKAKIQEIKGTVKVEGTVEVQGKVQVEGVANKDSLLKRGFMALEDTKWRDADDFFDKVLDIAPECGEAYLGKLMQNLQVSKREELKNFEKRFDENENYQKIMRFGDAALVGEVKGANESVLARMRVTGNRLAPSLARTRLASSCIAAGGGHIVGLRTDGTVIAVGDNKDGQCNVSAWRDIVAIAAGSSHTVGLKSDGTVVATEYMGDKMFYHGQCEIRDWRDIVAITAGGNCTIGLKSDGTVMAVGDNKDGQCNVSTWRDIVAIAVGCDCTIGLKSDGTVVTVGRNTWGQCNVGAWRDIVAIAAALWYTVGLKSDGTVVAVGSNGWGQCNVSTWRDIVAIATGCDYTIGLKSDGAVVAVGRKNYGQCKVSGWRLFNSIDTLEKERAAAKPTAGQRRIARIYSLIKERYSLRTELTSLKGLFAGKRRKEIETRLEEIDAELKKLNG